jgi:hypothetical protein
MEKKSSRPLRKVTPEMVETMVALRKEGWSYKYIGRKVGVSDDTARLHAPFGETTKIERDQMKEFTEEMTAVGWEIVARLKREGRWKE